jgi:hypothetical protein
VRRSSCLLALVVLMAEPACADVIRIDFAGAFAGQFSTPAYANGTGYGGSITFDSATAVINSTSNSVGTFARFNNAGTFGLGIGPDSFKGSVDILTNDLKVGSDNIRFFLSLGNGFTFNLAYLLPQTAINGAVIPSDPGILSGLPTGSISNAQMRGNFGVASATASLVAVPEPTSWALMISGFGLIGGAMRRQRKVETSVRFA